MVTEANTGINIGILGAGTWGIALARMLCGSGHSVSVWSALPEEIDGLRSTHIHPKFPDIVLPDSLSYTSDIAEVCGKSDMLIAAVPSVYIRSTTRTAAPYLRDGQIIVSVAKGIEAETLFTMTEVIEDELGDIVKERSVRIAALSGPTHAEEVIRYMPTTILSSCPDIETAEVIQDVFMNTCMRVYTNTDIKGVELCGALKNIIALASGMLNGLGLGDNIRAALITRGMAEIKRLGMKMGCREQTFYGLAGIGDLIVTALSVHSRNFKAGTLIGQGKDAETAVREVGMVVEGMNAIKPALELSEKYDTELPIITAVDHIISGKVSPSEALYGLMEREKRSELSEYYSKK
ncbi:MAG: NAD(P)-dependent glycerol-3-phosphate dehydrogenase [Ruminococcus sp.]|nr:NAD(P)-dependent glycerol-3-phosphate dehydrogenase [Ruminococcus sp.]